MDVEHNINGVSLAVYAFTSFLLVLFAITLIYVACAKRYRLNWFEKNLLETADTAEMNVRQLPVDSRKNHEIRPGRTLELGVTRYANIGGLGAYVYDARADSPGIWKLGSFPRNTHTDNTRCTAAYCLSPRRLFLANFARPPPEGAPRTTLLAIS
ncbi:unnamed protein product [Bemisia tabaci]|uniref:Uncharacterized protein n=1 Tax=Bemisia tabaci TaxID=7038 RepID=A0A9P0F5N0_BEMTA|nr:unnamed protein product [Bemisia tabaci]